MTKKEIIGTATKVKVVTGKNFYSNFQKIAVIGKMPTKKSGEFANIIGLRNETITEISSASFKPKDYSIIVKKAKNGYSILTKGQDY